MVAAAAGLVLPFALVFPGWGGARGLVCSLPLDFGRWVAGGRRGDVGTDTGIGGGVGGSSGADGSGYWTTRSRKGLQ